jgi:MoaA/NifB/PqqE/SkfB family radical SAM enzyme
MPKCSALYNHECVSVTGDRMPCCRFLENKSIYLAKNSSIKDYHNSDFINDIKKTMETGWHSGCYKCKNEEEAGLTSLRNLYNLDHSFSNNIESIELSLSNKCNLVCRMCSPTYSTKWESFLNTHSKLENFVSTKVEPVSINDIFTKDKDLSNLRFIKYLGGEPFITPELTKMFQILDEQHLLENITFMCSTNATLFPEKHLRYLKKFKLIRMHVSLDGVGVLNEYIRYGKSWNSIIKVLNLWNDYKNTYKNINLSIFTTVQAYNIHDINNLMALSDQLDFNFRGALLMNPSYLSINALPVAYVDRITNPQNEKFFKSYQFNKQNFIKFKKFTQAFDISSNLYLKNIVPELWKELTNEKF